MRPSKLFFDDHDYFRKRWIHRIRDDRYSIRRFRYFLTNPRLLEAVVG